MRGRSDGPMKRLLAICAAVGLIVTACGVIPGTGSGLKIGIVTDIGQLEDKSFNEFSWKGVQDGASAIGAPKPVAIVTKDIADYKQNIQQLVDQKYDVIFTVGFLIGTDTLAAAKANPGIQFYGVDQFVADPAPANYQGLTTSRVTRTVRSRSSRPSRSPSTTSRTSTRLTRARPRPRR
ncbi:MAG: BMP family ABC transporter substrate-binding protein [Chloroflexi bacterium]|nr:MAG: BMP family ABC transporter substrate-binding protein [Chloroflexota bacterium]